MGMRYYYDIVSSWLVVPFDKSVVYIIYIVAKKLFVGFNNSNGNLASNEKTNLEDSKRSRLGQLYYDIETGDTE